MSQANGQVVAVNGNMVSVQVDGDVSLNEVGYILLVDPATGGHQGSRNCWQFSSVLHG